MNDENKDLEVNKKNREDFENLMKETETNKDNYWDKNDPIVKALLGFIGVVILAGVTYFVVKFILR